MTETNLIEQLRAIRRSARELAQRVDTLLDGMPGEAEKTGAHLKLHPCAVEGRCTVATGHAVEQYTERTNTKRGVEYVLKMMAQRIASAEEWELKPQFRAVTLMDHGLREARYWKQGDILFVIDDTTCVTAHRMEAKRWQKKGAEL